MSKNSDLATLIVSLRDVAEKAELATRASAAVNRGDLSRFFASVKDYCNAQASILNNVLATPSGKGKQ